MDKITIKYDPSTKRYDAVIIHPDGTTFVEKGYTAEAIEYIYGVDTSCMAQ